MRRECWGSQRKGGVRLKEPSLVQRFYTPIPESSVFPPGLLPTSCHRAREESALRYQRSRVPQAYGQQTPQPGASWEMSSPDPSSGPVPSFLRAWGSKLSGPPSPHPSQWMKRFSHCSKSHLGSLICVKEGREALGEEKRL